MAKTKAPLFSLDATGTLDKNITYKGKKQNHIAQKYSKPGAVNPFESSPRQKDQRSIIRLITIHWQCMSSSDKLSWEVAAKDKRFKGSGYHYFLHMAQQNLTQCLGLVGYWSMNYNIDDKIPDLSGNGIHGILSPIYPCDSPTLVDSFDKKHGKAASFNGLTNYIEVLSNLDSYTSFSITAWIFPIISGADFYSILSNGMTATSGVNFLHRETSLKLFIPNITFERIDSLVNTININVWQHVACTYDGTTARLYIDGRDVKSGNLVKVSSGGDNIVLGASLVSKGSWSNQYYKGKIDAVTVWNRALDPREILKLSST